MAALSAALDMKPYLHAADINDSAYVIFLSVKNHKTQPANKEITKKMRCSSQEYRKDYISFKD